MALMQLIFLILVLNKIKLNNLFLISSDQRIEGLRSFFSKFLFKKSESKNGKRTINNQILINKT